jgi:hypothetical protein
MAGQVQRGLLPEGPPPDFPLVVAGHSAPTLDVGGDYFDYVRFRDGSAGVFVADVSGKGIPADLLMSMLRGLVRSNVGRLLGGALHLLPQRRLAARSTATRSSPSSACLRDDGMLQIANGGHNPTSYGRRLPIGCRAPSNLPAS